MRRKHPSFGFADLAKVSAPSAFDTALSGGFEDFAARLGFISREPVSSPRTSRSIGADAVHFTIEVMISDRDLFVAYCRDNDLTEREAFEKLIALLDR